MKNSITTLLNSFVHDNRNFIRENGGNAAKYIIETTEAEDQGWQWFLTDQEIDEYETADAARRAEIRDEIRAFVNEHYNYSI